MDMRVAIQTANADPNVHCIALKGAGRGFCGSYDLSIYATDARRGQTEGSQDPSKSYEPLRDYRLKKECTNCYAELLISQLQADYCANSWRSSSRRQRRRFMLRPRGDCGRRKDRIPPPPAESGGVQRQQCGQVGLAHKMQRGCSSRVISLAAPRQQPWACA